MVGLDPVVGVVLGVVHGRRDELIENPRIGGCLVRRHLDRDCPKRECPGEERARRSHVSPDRQPHVDDLPELIDRPVQVYPRPLTLT